MFFVLYLLKLLRHFSGHENVNTFIYKDQFKLDRYILIYVILNKYIFNINLFLIFFFF